MHKKAVSKRSSIHKVVMSNEADKWPTKPLSVAKMAKFLLYQTYVNLYVIIMRLAVIWT